MHNLNIIISKTNTKTGEMIRKVIGGEYNHCSFFIDKNWDTIYGFSRKYRDLWFTGCFTEENPLYYTEYKIYEIPLTDEQYADLSIRIAKMCENVKMYDYVAAALISIDVPKESERHYICSTFVADLVDKYTDIALEKNSHLYKPMNMLTLLESATHQGKAKNLNFKLPVHEEIQVSPSELLKAWTDSIEHVTKHASEKIIEKLYDDSSPCE